MRTIRKLSISGLLSFAPDSSPFDLQALNVLIGPNGSGKSNFIEVLAIEELEPQSGEEDVYSLNLP